MKHITHIRELVSLPLGGRLVGALREFASLPFRGGWRGQASPFRGGRRGLCALVGALLFSSCINEDLSKCPAPCADLTIRYVIQHVDSLDAGFASEIRSVHAGFWASDGLLYEEYILDEDELPDDMSFEVTLPADDYSHIVTANCERNDGRHRLFDDDIQTVSFEQPYMGPDTIEAMSRAAYLGTLGIDLNNRERTLYEVPLRPMVSKLELTVHYAEALTNIRCYIGEATKAGWMCWAGTAIDNERLVTDATRMATDVADSTKLYAFYAFPTVVDPPVPVTMLDAKPRATEEAGEWKLFFLSDYMDGDEQKTVQHTFTIEKNPLRVGEVFRGEFSINTTGGEYHDVEAGIEVDPDWNPGHGTDVEL